MSVVEPGRFREVLGHFATGVTVVTGIVDDQPIGFTCQSFASLSLDPPLVVFAAAHSSLTWPRLKTSTTLCVNILSAAQEHLGVAFSISGSDKFKDVDWHLGVAGAPILDGSHSWVECEIRDVYDGGDHELVVSRVMAVGMGAGEPLIFHRGAFSAMHPPMTDRYE